LPRINSIVKTADGQGTVDSVETLREIIRVKFKDGDDVFYKKYNAADVKIIKNATSEEMNEEELENIKELKALEDE